AVALVHVVIEDGHLEHGTKITALSLEQDPLIPMDLAQGANRSSIVVPRSGVVEMLSVPLISLARASILPRPLPPPVREVASLETRWKPAPSSCTVSTTCDRSRRSRTVNAPQS